MDILEKELQDNLFEKGCFEPDETKFGTKISFVETEFNIDGKRIDILGVDDKDNFYIIELKRKFIDGDAFTQVLDYMVILKKILNFNEINFNGIYCILVGERVTEPVENIIIDSKNIEYIEYEIDLKYKNLNMCFKEKHFIKLENTADEAKSYIEEYFGTTENKK
jgi:RecB family endonuclease NucS